MMGLGETYMGSSVMLCGVWEIIQKNIIFISLFMNLYAVDLTVKLSPS